jgi:DNA-binding FadR family transcriptional regulator
VDLSKVIRQCEDHLFIAKAFSVQERILYYHLLRQSRVEGQEQILVALLPLAKALGVAESTVRECIRSLNERGCLQILDRSRQGHLVRVPLPEEIPGVVPIATRQNRKHQHRISCAPSTVKDDCPRLNWPKDSRP